MSHENIRLTVRCPWRTHLEVDAEDRVWMKCRDCSRKQGKPVYHAIALTELQQRVGRISFGDSDAEKRPNAA